MSSHKIRSRSPDSPSHSRSRSPSSHHHHHHKRDRHHVSSSTLPEGTSPISESDYFLKSPEFRVWLKDEKDRYFDELSGDKARSYFRKFVKAWNRGKLSKKLYNGIDASSVSASSQTSYKWSFASKAARKDEDEIRRAREEVAAATKGETSSSSINLDTSSSRGKKAILGPTLPSRDDLILAREYEEDAKIAEKDYKRKRDRKEDKERVEDIVGPRESGREGMLEKKRLRRDNDKSFREAKEDTLDDYDDNTLMGGGDSFKARIAQRDAARRRFEEKRAGPRDEKMGSLQERRDAIKEKDKATMDMFKQLAKQRFG